MQAVQRLFIKDKGSKISRVTYSSTKRLMEDETRKIDWTWLNTAVADVNVNIEEEISKIKRKERSRFKKYNLSDKEYLKAAFIIQKKMMNTKQLILQNTVVRKRADQIVELAQQYFSIDREETNYFKSKILQPILNRVKSEDKKKEIYTKILKNLFFAQLIVINEYIYEVEGEEEKASQQENETINY
jgi:hypothetical protein